VKLKRIVEGWLIAPYSNFNGLVKCSLTSLTSSPTYCTTSLIIIISTYQALTLSVFILLGVVEFSLIGTTGQVPIALE
jgi:hypothetical protein